MNHRKLPELLEIEFEAILPGRNQHDQRYTQHPIIRNFLDETVREWSVDGKRIRVDYVGNSEEAAHKNNEYASTWFLRATLATWSKIRKCAGRPEDRPDNVVASCVLYRICMLRCIRARFREPAPSPSRDDCSRQTAASFSPGNAAGMAG